MEKEIALKLVDKLIIENITKISGTLFSKGTDLFKEYSINFGEGLKKYYGSVFDKYLYIKTIIDSEKKIPLRELYVPLDLQQGMKQHRTSSAADLFASCKHFVVIGLAGAGKSTLTKALFIDSVENNVKIPILVELRNLVFEGDIISSVVSYLDTYNLKISKSLFEALLQKGSFTLFFDGLDEMDNTVQEMFSSRIQSFRDKFHLNNIVLISRPFQFSKSFESFDTFKIKPLRIEQAVSLVDKIKYDSDVKRVFTEKLKSDIYAKHQSFASNPLLLTIMLMTFSQYSEIPEKVHVFYQQAFEALFQRHDMTKGKVFHRKSFCNLSIYDYERIFAYFCFTTLYDSQISFTRETLHKSVERARTFFSGLPFSTENFVNDSIQNVCLLCAEGFEYLFVHRSFQEFFCAKFIVNQLPDNKLEGILRSFNTKIKTRTLFELIYDMKPYVLEKYFVLPLLHEIKRKYVQYGKLEAYLRAEYFKALLVSTSDEYGVIFHGGAKGEDEPSSRRNVDNLSLVCNIYKIDRIYALENVDRLPKGLKKHDIDPNKSGRFFVQINTGSSDFPGILQNNLLRLKKFFDEDIDKLIDLIGQNIKKHDDEIEKFLV